MGHKKRILAIFLFIGVMNCMVFLSGCNSPTRPGSDLVGTWYPSTSDSSKKSDIPNEGYIFKSNGTGSCFLPDTVKGDSNEIGKFQWSADANNNLNLTNMVWVPSVNESNEEREFTYTLSPDGTRLNITWVGVGLIQTYIKN